MRKIISLAFAIVLLLGGAAYATVDIASGDNAVILGSHMGGTGIVAATEVIKVSTGSTSSASVGDVMIWDYSNAADGYHVTQTARDSTDGITDTGCVENFAGVMVTTTSQESEYSYTTPMANGGPVGYMAIRGLVRAKIDGSASTVGRQLKLNGRTLHSSFATVDPSAANKLSEDIGVLLESTAGDGLQRVWLK